eukprot:UN07927
MFYNHPDVQNPYATDVIEMTNTNMGSYGNNNDNNNSMNNNNTVTSHKLKSIQLTTVYPHLSSRLNHKDRHYPQNVVLQHWNVPILLIVELLMHCGQPVEVALFYC